MYDVVLALDHDEDRAVAQADAVAALPHAEGAVHATVFHDFRSNPNGASVHQLASVRRARAVLEDAGVSVTLAESSGDPATEILAVAEERDADLVCLAGRKRSPARKAVFGSVSEDVIRQTDRPVLVCGARGGGEDR